MIFGCSPQTASKFVGTHKCWKGATDVLSFASHVLLVVMPFVHVVLLTLGCAMLAQGLVHIAVTWDCTHAQRKRFTFC